MTTYLRLLVFGAGGRELGRAGLDAAPVAALVAALDPAPARLATGASLGGDMDGRVYR